MRGVNKAILVGILGNDPDVRTTAGGVTVANISIATNETWTDKQGEKQEKTEWHRVVFFNRLAEIVRDFLKKGRTVYVEGRINTEKYTDKEGIERWGTKIIAYEMQMLDSGKNENTADFNATPASQTSPVSEPSAPLPKPEAAPPAPKVSGGGDYDDDIPF